eukprot:12760233-Ditylum_brightwellii.AAC.1
MQTNELKEHEHLKEHVMLITNGKTEMKKHNGAVRMLKTTEELWTSRVSREVRVRDLDTRAVNMLTQKKIPQYNKSVKLSLTSQLDKSARDTNKSNRGKKKH